MSKALLSIIWAGHLAAARLRWGWRARITIIAGVLLTTIIGAMVPLYTTLVAQVGMVQRIDAQPAGAANIDSRVGQGTNQASLEPLWSTLDDGVRAAAHTALDPVSAAWLDQIVTWSESSPAFVSHDGIEVENLQLRAAYFEDWQNHARLVDGGLEATTDAGAAGVISQELADRFGWSVGDILTLDQRGWETSQPFTVEITGIAAPDDTRASYWMSPSPLRVENTNGIKADILLDRATFLRVVGAYMPQTRSAFGWRFLFNHDELPFGRIPQAVEQLRAFEAELTRMIKSDQQLSLIFTTDLPKILTAYAGEVSLLNAPFGTLMLQVGGLALFFLLITAALAQRSERREIAMLKQRGALDRQIILLHGIEALIISAAAALVAPFIARQALIAFAPLLAENEHITLELTAQPFIYTCAAGILAVIVLLITLRPVLRLPLSSAGGSRVREAHQSWWQRTYLDLLLLVVGSAALFRLLATDSPFAQSLLGGIHADPLLLIAPALLFVALGSVTLRLFPLMTSALAQLFAGRRGIEGVLAAWSVSRDPAHYSRIAFLLALAIGVGWFATSFQATLTQSYADQASYRVGADVRLIEDDSPHPANAESLRQMDGVHAATTALRLDDLNFSLDGSHMTPGTLLAVDGESFASTAYWREDLGALALPPSPDLPTPGITLPTGTTKLGAWLRLNEMQLNVQTGELSEGFPLIASLYSDLQTVARVRDASGAFQQMYLTPIRIEGVENTDDLSRFVYMDNPFAPDEMEQAERDRLSAALEGVSGWVYLEGDIDPAMTGELQIDMLYWNTDLSEARYASVWRRVTVGGLTAFDATGTTFTVDPSVREDWSFVLDNTSIADGEAELTATDKGAGWQITWTQRQDRTTLSIGLSPDAPPVPAVVSSAFARENALDSGATFDLYIDSRPATFVVAGTTDYFPTLYADQAPFAVADRDALLYALNRRPASAFTVNETLIALGAGADAQAWVQENLPASQNVLTTTDVLESLRGDVLALGLSHLLLIGFIIALILSVVSLFVYMALNAQSRRDQFAVLRALGLSSGRIALSVTLEQLVLFIVAVVLGGVMGVLLSGQVLPSLAISGGGSAITPPFLVRLEPTALRQYVSVLAALLILVLIASTILIRRLSLGQALRYQEE
ncbi:MAG: ABC transporter permease [Anaerolineae bacterium]|nr:ABC transporter permease [Anaerolineae bacterium]